MWNALGTDFHHQANKVGLKERFAMVLTHPSRRTTHPFN
jgi:hypothetical protein